MPVTSVRTTEKIVATSLAESSLTLLLLVVAAVVALVLGVVAHKGFIGSSLSQVGRGLRSSLPAIK